MTGRRFPHAGHRSTGLVRLALKGMLALAVPFVLLIGAIRFTPRQPSEAVRFLTPPNGCPMPCWYGIRPGVTTADEALRLLLANPWNGRVVTSYYDASAGDGIITWVWNEAALAGVERFGGVRLRVRDRVVWNITLPPGIPLSDVWFAFGAPTGGDWTIVNTLTSPGYRIEQALNYTGKQIVVTSRVLCPAKLIDFWRARSVVQLGEPENEYTLEPIVLSDSGVPYHLRHILRDQAACR